MKYRTHLLLLLFLTLASSAQTAPEAAIRQLLDQQTAAWNRGDVDAFMTGYEDSPETTFVGQTVQYGYATIRDRYKKAYSHPGRHGETNLLSSCDQNPGLRLRHRHRQFPFRANRGRRRQCRRDFLPLTAKAIRGLEDYLGPQQPNWLNAVGIST